MEKEISQIGIVGGGALGQALSHALVSAGIPTLIFDKDTASSSVASAEELAQRCSVVLLCIPSWAVRGAAKQIAEVPTTGPRLVISLSKGVEAGFATMDQVLRSALPDNIDVGVMYGPMLATEIMDDKTSSAVFALSNTDWETPLRAVFSRTTIKTEYTGDLRSTAICAVMKNVYATGLGICDGLGLGMNAKGKLTVLAIRELKQILADNQADPSAAEGLAGLGDLVATGFSSDSFNHRAGKKLGNGTQPQNLKSEGLTTLRELAGVADITKYPLASTLHNIALLGADPTTIKNVL